MYTFMFDLLTSTIPPFWPWLEPGQSLSVRQHLSSRPDLFLVVPSPQECLAEGVQFMDSEPLSLTMAFAAGASWHSILSAPLAHRATLCWCICVLVTLAPRVISP